MKHRWTKAKKERFLKALTETANVSELCRRVGMSRRSAYDLRAADRVFAELWDDATETAVDHLEREAWRRALEGHEEPVFQRGKKVGTVRKYSDRLLIFLLSGNRPERYRVRAGKEQLHEEMVKNPIKHFVPSEKQAFALGFLQEGGGVDFSVILKIQEGLMLQFNPM